MKVLIVYYSRTGTTKKVAERLSQELGAECEEIIDHKKRAGFFGFLGAGLDALRKKVTKIDPPEKDPAGYDLVIVGTPIWAGLMAPAARTFLSDNRGKIKKIAFLATMGGAKLTKAWADMQTVCCLSPVATVAVSAKQMSSGEYITSLKDFAAKLSAHQSRCGIGTVRDFASRKSGGLDESIPRDAQHE